MQSHRCSACGPHSSRREVIAGLGAAAALAMLPARSSSGDCQVVYLGMVRKRTYR